jgi:putative glutamine amidotransferase
MSPDLRAPTALPLVLVSGARAHSGDVLRVRANAAYTSAVERAGGVPLVVPPIDALDPETAADRLLTVADGLLLTGGEDVDPAHYGAAPHPATQPPDPRRDATELALVRAARARGVPVLAICRGVQVLNVAFGGTLVQDLPSEHPSAVAHDPRTGRDQRSHPIAVAPDSRLAAALGTTALTTNSLHHQAPDACGAGLRVVATAPDGVVEGLEWTTSDWWALGVQWHPEELTATDEPWDRSLFAAFLAAVRSRREEG